MREVSPEHAANFETWADEMIDTVRSFDGCLGATYLEPSGASNAYQMVFRFCDAVALRSWERSDKRADLLARVENWVLREKVTTVIGEDQFFTTLASAKPPRPLLLRLLLDVLWVFPVAFLWGSVIAPWFAPLPGWARTFVSAAVITAALDVVVFPLRTKLRSHRLLPLNHTNSTGQPASTANIGRWGRLSSAVITFKKARA